MSSLRALALALVLTACQDAPQPPAAQTPLAEAPDAEAPAGPVQTGKASFYGPGLEGEETASGEPLDPNAMTAASRTLPLGTKAKVINKENGRTVHVEVTDRGPYAKNRILDVTPKAAAKLGMKEDGVAQVEVQPVAPVR